MASLDVLFLVIFCFQYVLAQSSGYSSQTCVRRSVILYTSDSSTYVVTDLGSTSISSSTVCPAPLTLPAITTTVYAPNVTLSGSVPPAATTTVTVYQESTAQSTTSGSTPAPTTTQGIFTDYGFENGTNNPFDTSTNSSAVSAEVVSDGPLRPYTGNNYLLVTFGQTPSRPKRQATLDTPAVYNISQSFSAESGTSYTLSAYAEAVANGGSNPNCSLTICGNDQCDVPHSLTSSYVLYSFVYTLDVTASSAVGLFSVQCSGNAYVGLDDISVTSGASSPASTVTVTTTIGGSAEVVTVYSTLSDPPASTMVTTEVSTVYVTTTQSGSQYPASTVVEVQTNAITITQAPYTVYQTLDAITITVTPSELATTLQVLTNEVTLTQAPYTVYQTLDAATVTLTPSDLVTTIQVLTNEVTLTQAPYTVYQTLDPSTITVTPSDLATTREVLTNEITVTEAPYAVYQTLEPSTITVTPSDLATTREVLTDEITVTEAPYTVYQTLDAATVTLTPSDLVTTREILTNEITVTEAPYTVYQTLEPETVTITPDVSTVIQTNEVTLTQKPTTVYLTTTGVQTNEITTTPSDIYETVTYTPDISIVTETQTRILTYTATPTTSDASATSSSCPADYTDSQSEVWDVSCDEDYSGGEITHIITPDLYSCIEKCTDYGTECVSVSYFFSTPDSFPEDITNYCYLRSLTTSSTKWYPAYGNMYSATRNEVVDSNDTASTSCSAVTTTETAEPITITQTAPAVTETAIESTVNIVTETSLSIYSYPVTDYTTITATATTSQTATRTITQTTITTTTTNPCGQIYTDRATPTHTWKISCITDYPSGNLYSTVEPDLYSCIDLCVTYAGCAAVVWVQSGQAQQYCYLKNAGQVASPTPFGTSLVAFSGTKV